MHAAQARMLIESKEPVDLKLWKKNGEIVEATNIVCTSSYFHGNTYNLKFLDSDEFRKVKAICIHEVNGEEVYL